VGHLWQPPRGASLVHPRPNLWGSCSWGSYTQQLPGGQLLVRHLIRQLLVGQLHPAATWGARLVGHLIRQLLVGQLLVGQLLVGHLIKQLLVGQLLVGQLLVGQLLVGQLLVGQLLVGQLLALPFSVLTPPPPPPPPLRDADADAAAAAAAMVRALARRDSGQWRTQGDGEARDSQGKWAGARWGAGRALRHETTGLTCTADKGGTGDAARAQGRCGRKTAGRLRKADEQQGDAKATERGGLRRWLAPRATTRRKRLLHLAASGRAARQEGQEGEQRRAAGAAVGRICAAVPGRSACADEGTGSVRHGSVQPAVPSTPAPDASHAVNSDTARHTALSPLAPLTSST